MEFVLLRNRGEVSALSPAARTLVGESIAQPNATYLPEYFLPRVHRRAAPRVVACFEAGRLAGVLYAYERTIAGIGTGYAFGGDYMGRGCLVAPPQREQAIFAAACGFLLGQGMHALRLDWTPSAATCHPQVEHARLKVIADPRREGDWMRLAPGYGQFLAGLGPRTRRNLRYCRRKCEEAGLTYSGTLARGALESALSALNRLADYPIDKENMARDRRYMATFPPVIAGLRNTRGEFVSLLLGFTAGTHLHILTQLNGGDEGLRKLSLSLVLRGHVIEDFILRGFTAVHFYQGSSPTLGRHCAPVDLHHFAFDRPDRWTTPFKMACAALAALLHRRGIRVPRRLSLAAGSYWEETADPSWQARPLFSKHISTAG